MLKFLQIALLVFLAVLILCVFSLYVSWSDTLGGDCVIAAVKSALLATNSILAIVGLIFVGDATLLHKRFWGWVRNQILQSQPSIILLLSGCFVGVLLVGMAWALLRPVVFSTNLNLTLTNYDTPGVRRDIGKLEGGKEQKVLLRIGTRLIGYRVDGTECTGALAPIQIPHRFSKRPVHRFHIDAEETKKKECNRETLWPRRIDLVDPDRP